MMLPQTSERRIQALSSVDREPQINIRTNLKYHIITWNKKVSELLVLSLASIPV